MSDFLHLCRLRSSVRAYSGQPIPDDVLQYIMACVQQAPSAVNFQPWKFQLCTNSEEIEKLKKCYNRPWFDTVNHCFIVYRNKAEEWVRKYDGKPHGDIDAAIAIEHLCLAAAEKGLGTCWICAFDPEEFQRQFDIPENMEPVALIPIGYPLEGALEPKEKKRKELSAIFSLD